MQQGTFTATDAVIDLETLGKGRDAAVLSIGITLVDRHTRTVGDTFHQHVSLESVVQCGGRLDASTVLWWLGQSQDARDAVVKGQETEAMHPAVVLIRVADLLEAKDDGQAGGLKVWGNGATFDLGILGDMYDRHNIPRPWAFWNERDLRTVVDEAGLDKATVPKPEGFIAHHAGWDSRFQAELLVAAWHKLKPFASLNPNALGPRIALKGDTFRLIDAAGETVATAPALADRRLPPEREVEACTTCGYVVCRCPR